MFEERTFIYSEPPDKNRSNKGSIMMTEISNLAGTEKDLESLLNSIQGSSNDIQLQSEPKPMAISSETQLRHYLHSKKKKKMKFIENAQIKPLVNLMIVYLNQIPYLILIKSIPDIPT